MALKTKVLVSGINNLSDARYCAGMGVDIIGFNFDPENPDHISTETFKEIAGWISGVSYVGEFGNSELDYIKDIAEELGFDCVEIESPENIQPLQELDIPVILKIDISDYEVPSLLFSILDGFKDSVLYFNLTASAPVSEESWNELRENLKNYPILLGFNVEPGNVNTLLDAIEVQGISLKGGYEIKPGFKDFDELAEIIEAIEIDDTV